MSNPFAIPGLPESKDSKEAAHPVGRMLSRRRRKERWLAALLLLDIGLLATLAAVWTAHARHASGLVGTAWTGGLALSLLLGGAGALYGLRGRHPHRIAADLDETLGAKNRLEAASQLAAAQLGDRENPLADAQRHETASFLEEKAPRALRPGPDLFSTLAVAAPVLALLHFLSLGVWLIAGFSFGPHKEKPLPPRPGPGPQAEIVWRSPSAETKASAIESVPLRATATSTSGLNSLRLEVQVNGAPRKTIPLDPAAVKEGKADLALDLALDELELEPFDMVSYYLTGARIVPDPKVQPLALTSSPVQFIEIRPFRDDVRVKDGGDGNAAYALITALKSAQLRLLKENFMLAHADIARDNAAWKEENARVGKDQDLLARKTAEAVEKLTQQGVAAQIVYLIQQAHDLMPPAAKEITEARNENALPGQGKALALITEVEKFLVKEIAPPGKVRGSVPPVADPFKDQQKVELPKREETPAGMLEKLAKEQDRLAKDLSSKAPSPGNGSSNAKSPETSPGDSSASTSGSSPAASSGDGSGKPPEIKPGVAADSFSGTPSERQTLVSQGIASLLNGKKLPDAVASLLDKAHTQALDSLKQLDAGDTAKAREPAAATAASLQAAIAEMDKEGKEQAKKDFADVQALLNDAAQKASQAGQPGQPGDPTKADAAQAAAQEVSEAHRRLQEEAQKQQQSGSAAQAKKLNDLANTVGATHVTKDLQDLNAAAKSPSSNPGDVQAKAAAAASTLRDLAAAAARQGQDGPPQAAQLAALASSLERSQAALARLAAAPSASSAASSAPGAGKEPSPQPSQNGKGKGEQGQGQGQTPAQTPAPGQGQTPAPGQGQTPGQGQGQSDKGQGEGKGEGQSKEPAPGNGNGDGETGNGGGASPSKNDKPDPSRPTPNLAKMTSAQREAIAREVQAALRDQVDQASALLENPPVQATPNPADQADPATGRNGGSGSGSGKGSGPAALRTLRKNLNPNPNYAPVLVPYEKIAGPLDELIRWVHAELAKTARQEVLSVDDPSRAPAAYRDAVADYFERLSKDFEAAPKPQPQPQPALAKP